MPKIHFKDLEYETLYPYIKIAAAKAITAAITI